MIRWYDYIFAVLVADFLLVNAIFVFTAPEWWMAIISAVSVWVLWELWETYCLWRRKKELEK